jgi:flagellar biosynthesis/type III secretory pathway M-ring protein FliF/YscJ
MVPKFRDKYFTLPELEKVSVIKKTDGLLVKTETYIFNFIFKNKKSDSKLKSSISFSINKKEDLNVEQLQEKINDALQNNKNFKYEVFSGKNFSFIRDYVIWSLLFLFIIIFAFIKVLKAEKKSIEQDKKNLIAKETTLSNEINDSIIK